MAGNGPEVGRAHVGLTVDGSGMNEDIAREVEKAAPAVEKSGKDQGERFSSGFLDRIRGLLGKGLNKELGASGSSGGEEFTRGLTNVLDKGGVSRNPFSRLIDRWMADVAKRAESGGRKTGLTSLDNFLRGVNVPGSPVASGFIKTLGGIIGAFDGIGSAAGKVFTTFATGFAAAEDGASLFSKTLGGFAQFGAASGSAGAESGGGIIAGLGTIAVSGPAIAAAIAVIVSGLAVFVSIAGALLAILTALAAAIATAFVGALLIAGAAMGAFVAAGALVTLAFKSMTDAQKNFFSGAKGAGFAQLHAELTGIGQLMLGPILGAVHIMSTNIQNALTGIIPLAAEMGHAFASVGVILTQALSGPGFRMFETALATYLPGIIVKLAHALGSFLNGMLAIFTPLLPYVSQFAGYLATVAREFARWATSAQGQNAIVSFVVGAVNALKGLWMDVQAIGKFIAAVLFDPSATQQGTNIFTGIANAFNSFTRDIQRAKADGSFQKWLNDGIKFGAALWGVIKALFDIFMALYSSGILDFITNMMRGLGVAIQWTSGILGDLVSAIGPAFDHISAVVSGSMGFIASSISDVYNAVTNLFGLLGKVNTTNPITAFQNGYSSSLAGGSGPAPQTIIPGLHLQAKPKVPTIPQIDLSGLNALNQTSLANGGYMPNPTKTKAAYHNPYVAFANSLIAQGPSTKAQLRNAMLSLNKQAAAGIASAARDTGGSGSVIASLNSMVDNLRTGGAQAVNTAQQALTNAAQSLANASSAKAAKAALQQVHAAQKDLQAALNYQANLNADAKILAGQNFVSRAIVDKMVAGFAYSNATLADYAAARQIIAARLSYYNQQLTAAIAMRDNYSTSVSGAAKTFADLTAAQAQVINGITQALTAGDVTTNLQTKLDQIKKFQNDLKLLLAQGLSNAAYKQIVDSGVTTGTSIADALLAGGNGAIQNTNSLVGQINSVADQLGADTSSRLYQAGVDAAKGLVDGLTSLSGQLDKAATALGNSIANAVKRSLGIRSPSRVLREMMGYVGDGAVLGLQDQHVKVGSAAATLANLIAVNPGTGPRAAGGPVSGNGDQRPIELTVVTPTKDPVAAGHEAINELVGRL